MNNTNNKQTFKTFNEFCIKVSKLSDSQLEKVIHQFHLIQNQQCDLSSETVHRQAEKPLQ